MGIYQTAHDSPVCFQLISENLFTMFSTGVSVGSDGPENVAVNSGERSKFTCKTKSDSRLRWSMKLTGENDERILTREGQILPTFAGTHYVESSSGQLNLIIRNTTLLNAGRYICLELSTSKTASAELIVIGKRLIYDAMLPANWHWSL